MLILFQINVVLLTFQRILKNASWFPEKNKNKKNWNNNNNTENWSNDY